MIFNDKLVYHKTIRDKTTRIGITIRKCTRGRNTNPTSPIQNIILKDNTVMVKNVITLKTPSRPFSKKYSPERRLAVKEENQSRRHQFIGNVFRLAKSITYRKSIKYIAIEESKRFIYFKFNAKNQ